MSYSYPTERDKALVEFVKNDNLKPWVKVCKKYGITRPSSWKVERAAIYKMVQYCTNIPEDVKVLAMQKCLKMGFNPLIKPIEAESEEV